MCPPVASNGHAVIDVPLDGTVELGEGAPASALPSKPTPTVKRASTRSKLSAMVPHPAWMEFRGRRPSLGPSPVIPRLRSTYNDASGHENSVHGGKPGELAPLAFSGKFAGGLRADIKRRAPFYLDDWIEPLRPANLGQSMASCIFLFFACLSPAVTFGMLFSDGTDGQLGVVEMLLSSGISGIFYSLFAGQPISILGATGPELAYTVVFYRMCQGLELEFLPARCWEGLWTALFTTLLAIFDLSALMKHVRGAARLPTAPPPPARRRSPPPPLTAAAAPTTSR